MRGREFPVRRRPGSVRSEGASPRRSSDPAVSEARPGTSRPPLPPPLGGDGLQTRASVEVSSRASFGKECRGNAGRGAWDPCDPAPGRVGRYSRSGSRVAVAPGRPGDAVPRPPVCPVSSDAFPACMNHLPTVHQAGEDEQGMAAAFIGRQSHLNSRFSSRSHVSVLN